MRDGKKRDENEGKRDRDEDVYFFLAAFSADLVTEWTALVTELPR